MTHLMICLKTALTIMLSVAATILLLKKKPSYSWVEVDMTKLIQQQAIVLGRQNLSQEAIEARTKNVLPRILKHVHALGQRHNVMILRKGVLLSPLPDWTDRVSKALEEEQ